MGDIRLLTARRPARPLAGVVAVPGDEAASCCALLLAGLAVGESAITGLIETGGVLGLAEAVRLLGAVVARDGPGAWRVAGRGIGGLREPAAALDLRGSATAARLLCGVLASHDLFAVVTGDAGLRRCSLEDVTVPLAACGARFTARKGGRLPLAVQGAWDALPVECRLPVAPASVKAALLLAGLNAPGWTRVEEPSPTDDGCELLLRRFGAEVAVEAAGGGRVASVMGQPELRATGVDLPGDPALAALPLVAASVVPGSEVTVRGVGLNPMRAGLFTILRDMGARLEVANERATGEEPVGDVTAFGRGKLRGVEVPAERAAGVGHGLPILAVAAACAAGPTRIRGVAGGQVAAVAAMLGGNGVQVETARGDLLVHGAGTPPGGGVVAANGDAQVAASALVLGLAAAAAVGVDDPAPIEAGFPGFLALMRGLGALLP